jgi:hypothetical protein
MVAPRAGTALLDMQEQAQLREEQAAAAGQLSRLTSAPLQALQRTASSALGRARSIAPAVRRPFPSWNRSSILTEIHLCHACSDHDTEGGNGRAGGAPGGGPRPRRGGRRGGDAAGR